MTAPPGVPQVQETEVPVVELLDGAVARAVAHENDVARQRHHRSRGAHGDCDAGQSPNRLPDAGGKVIVDAMVGYFQGRDRLAGPNQGRLEVEFFEEAVLKGGIGGVHHYSSLKDGVWFEEGADYYPLRYMVSVEWASASAISISFAF